MIQLQVDFNLLNKFFGIPVSRITQYANKDIEEIMELEAQQGNQKAADYKKILSDPDKILEIFKLTNLENKFIILQNMSEGDLDDLLPYLEQDQLAKGLNFFTEEKLIEMSKALPIEVLACMILEKFAMTDVLTLMEEDSMNQFIMQPDVERKYAQKYFEGLDNKSLEKIMAQSFGEEFKGKDREEYFEYLENLNDEDYKRFYPYETLASKVLGFTGSDNQGILGLEVKYDFWLKGENGKILTLATAHGVEIENAAETIVTPMKGNSIKTSLDVVIQSYVTQIAMKVLEAKSAKSVSIILMNPQNGEIYAMANVPEYNLNEPYTLTEVYIGDNTEESLASEKKTELLNQMWRNSCISDTYEPGSAFKIITAAAAFEHGVLKLSDTFHCPGYKIVADRRIRCHKVAGHGSQTFVEAIMNSCNPVFMGIALKSFTCTLYLPSFTLLDRLSVSRASSQ